MSSTVTSRTRELRRQLDEAKADRAKLLEAIDEWAEAIFRRDKGETHKLLANAAQNRVRMAESKLLSIHGRAW